MLNEMNGYSGSAFPARCAYYSFPNSDTITETSSGNIKRAVWIIIGHKYLSLAMVPHTTIDFGLDFDFT